MMHYLVCSDTGEEPFVFCKCSWYNFRCILLCTQPVLSPLHTMAAASASLLHLATPTLTRSTRLAVRLPSAQLSRWPSGARIAAAQPPRAYKVTIEHGGESRVVEVEEDETILSRALDEGLDVPHDCKLGVCMTCPARLVSGTVDQSDGMLSDDVVARGYALLCAAYPRSDCTIRVIPEDELLKVQLATADD